MARSPSSFSEDTREPGASSATFEGTSHYNGPRTKKRNICQILKTRQEGAISHLDYISTTCSNEKYIQKLQYESLKGHAGCVNTVSWNPAGTMLVSGSDDQRLKIWNPHGKVLLRTIETPHTGNIFCAKFMPHSNDTQIISCACEPNICVFDLSRQSNPLVHRYTCHTDIVHKLSIEPGSSSVFLSCSADGTARQFDLRQKEKHDVLADLSHAKQGRFGRGCITLNSVDFNPLNTNYFIIGGDDPYIRLYDRRMPIGLSNDGIASNTVAATAITCVQKYAPKQLVETKQTGFYGGTHITGVRFNCYGDRIIGTYSGDDVYMFNIDGGPTARPEKERSRDGVLEEGEIESEEEEESPIIGEKLDYVYTPAQRYKGHVNVRTVKEVNFLGPHSEYVISGSDCGHIFIWETDSGRLVNVMKGDRHVVNCLDPHPSYNLMFASSGIESDCKIWAPTKPSDDLKDPSSFDDIINNNQRGTGQFVVSPNLLLSYLLRGGFNQDSDEEDESEEEENPRQRRRMNTDTGERAATQRQLAEAVAQLLTNSDWVDEDSDEEGLEEEDTDGGTEEPRANCRTM